jgi:hypothetical protein
MAKFRALLLVDFEGDYQIAAEIEKNLQSIVDMVYDQKADAVAENSTKSMPDRIVPKDYRDYMFASTKVKERRGDGKPDLNDMKIRTS